MNNKFNIFTDYQTIDGKALAQMEDAMSNDWAIRGALMPDVHAGYTLPIGAVVEATKIVPAWVGYDIGCGVGCMITNIDKSEITHFLEDIKEKIFDVIPVGFGTHESDGDYSAFYNRLSDQGKVIMNKRSKGQLGTLGGGNHFIEVGFDNKDRVTITVHSGSRGLGHGLATYYMDLAKKSTGGSKLEDHNPLDPDTPLGNDYLSDALVAQDYALENRQSILCKVLDIISNFLGRSNVKVVEFINRNHNHVEATENNTYIHRKGATHADKGMLGVIPGNMRDGCFVVKGKGNPAFLNSSSHGAGRVLSRKKAKENFSMEEFEEQMKHIVGTVSLKTLDEAPDAYKSIFEVMDMQKDSVEIINYLKPMINIKG